MSGQFIGNNFKFPSDYSVAIGTTSTGLTGQTTNISLPNGLFPNPDASYLITTYNNSTVTNIVVTPQNYHTSFGQFSTNVWSDLTSFTVALTTSTTIGTIIDNIVQGWLIGSGTGRLKISNVTTGTSDQTATAYFRITKI